MSSSYDARSADVAELRRQVEILMRRIEELAHAGDSAARIREKDEEIPWLVIAAVVATTVKAPFRIMNVQLSGLPPLNLWSIEGRRAVFHSHRVR